MPFNGHCRNDWRQLLPNDEGVAEGLYFAFSTNLYHNDRVPVLQRLPTRRRHAWKFKGCNVRTGHSRSPTEDISGSWHRHNQAFKRPRLDVLTPCHLLLRMREMRWLPSPRWNGDDGRVGYFIPFANESNIFPAPPWLFQQFVDFLFETNPQL